MSSKAVQSTRVISNEASAKQFNQDTVSDATLYPGNRYNFRGAVLGDSTVDEIRNGGWSPNAQSALMQLAMASVLPVGSLLMSTDATNPFNTEQFQETITFGGSSTVTYIELYNVSIEVAVGDAGNDVAAKAFDALIATDLFDIDPGDYTPGTATFILKHKSSRPHATQYTSVPTVIVNPDGTNTGITAETTITGASDGEFSVGYGVWSLFHTDTSTFPAPVYYYQRTS
ncbi:baseplate wedge subunit [Vibrio phage D479]